MPPFSCRSRQYVLYSNIVLENLVKGGWLLPANKQASLSIACQCLLRVLSNFNSSLLLLLLSRFSRV